MTTAATTTRLADDPQMPRVGQLVGQRYEVEGVLGEGGFAVVYRAYDTRTKARVAVKVLDPIMSRRTEFSSRFMREVETVSRLRHHNTISVFDAGETEAGCLYLVMELLDGRPLDEVIASDGALDAERVRTIAAQILKSLQEAHALGIIHRDLKPANVFLANIAGEDDYVKVLDFGIAKSLDESQDSSLTATGQVVCSPHYVAPERVREHITLPSSDLYSLGVLMVELLEGAPPYDGESAMMVAAKHLGPEPVPMGERTRATPYVAVIERACEKGLDARYDSAIEMLDDLNASKGERPAATLFVAPEGATRTMAPAVVPPEPVAESGEYIEVPRSKAGLWVALGALLLLALGAGWFVTRDGGPPVADVASVEPPIAAPAPPPAAPAPPPSDPVDGVRNARLRVAAAYADAALAALRRAQPGPTEVAAAMEPEPAADGDEEAGETDQDTARDERDDDARERAEREERRAERRREAESRAREAAAELRAEEERRQQAAAEPAPAAPVAAPAEPEPEQADDEAPRRPRIRVDFAPED